MKALMMMLGGMVSIYIGYLFAVSAPNDYSLVYGFHVGMTFALPVGGLMLEIGAVAFWLFDE